MKWDWNSGYKIPSKQENFELLNKNLTKRSKIIAIIVFIMIYCCGSIPIIIFINSLKVDCQKVEKDIKKEHFRLKVTSIDYHTGSRSYTYKCLNQNQKVIYYSVSRVDNDIVDNIKIGDSLIKLDSSSTFVVVNKDSAIFFNLLCESSEKVIVKLNQRPFKADFRSIDNLRPNSSTSN